MVGTPAVYLDASALVKLIVIEPESEALRIFLDDFDQRVTSRIAAIEVPRAVALRSSLRGAPVDRLLRSVSFRELDAETARTAADLDPPALRSLDAIHLAAALGLASAVGAFVTYDLRLANAARSHGLRVESPGSASD